MFLVIDWSREIPFVVYYASFDNWLIYKWKYFLHESYWLIHEKSNANFDHKSINLTNLSILFFPFHIYSLSIINISMGKPIFHICNHCQSTDNKIHPFDNWSIKQNEISMIFHLFHIYSLSIIKKFMRNNSFQWN